MRERAELVNLDKENFKTKPIILTGDFIRSRGLVRHDSEKAARIIKMVL